jgi:GDP/UDP-N,N'-diacetylbacillosamine 2-epimerase (hydrolysing)
MPRKLNLCVVTGSRAEYGLLAPLMKLIKGDKMFNLQIIVTGMHLSPEFGLTFHEIEKEGLSISDKVEILLSSDTPTGISKTIGLGYIGLAESYERLQPDLLILLGDRYETFAAAGVANIFRIPIAHIHGGEVTEGAFDDAFRHAITKMSHLHFTSTNIYRDRVIQLGEEPSRVFNVGAIGLDNIKGLQLLSRRELEKQLGITLSRRNLLITFHPATAEQKSSKSQFAELLKALSSLDETFLLFTKANADTDGRIINTMIDKFVVQKPSLRAAFPSLGQLRYLSAMRCVDGVVGNSSSGIIEAPSFTIGTINIGNRQTGRIRAASVINCEPQRDAICFALKRLYSRKFQGSLKHCVNPYGDGKSAERIHKVLRQFPRMKSFKKSFYDIKIC